MAGSGGPVQRNTWDTTAPTVSSPSPTSATAKITDNLQGGLAADRMTLKVDGQPVPFQWDAASGTLSATLSGLGKSSHQVTVTAADTCGNLARDSVTLSGASSNPFADMTNHWARTYTARLSELGIISGITSGDVTNFYPNRNITRGDFALMAANWLGLDLNAYASVSLPYTDTKDIPSWDLNAVKALYELGIMQGSRANDGTLRANARASITRAEAMTILGRMTEKGYPQAALSAFSDAAAVPSWAKEHVATLVGMEVVGGSNGKLRPSSPVTRAEVAKMLFTL
ncbi:MAG: S-layer homology domain-containing protein [Evtepia gabavorous]